MAMYQYLFRMAVPALFMISACSDNGTAYDPHYMSPDNTTPTTPPIGSIAVGPGNAMLGMTIGMKLAPNNAYAYTFHKTAESWTTPCTITDTSATAVRDIFCTMEAKEFDLAFNGVILKINIPPDMCSYVGFDPYYFYSWQAGQGPDFLSYDVSANGSVIAGSVVAKYGGPTGTDASSVVFFKDGSPSCIYDHTNDEGPNCCYGKYSGVVRNFDTTTGTFQSSTIDDKWGGAASNCLSGPAVEVNSGKDINGFPLGFIYYTENVGISAEYSIAPRIGKQTSSVGIANQFVSSDYPLNNPNVPTAFLVPRGDPAVDKKEFLPNPYYTIMCFDRAKEIKARLRLLIQEWNVDSEFAKQGTANADPDTVGTEESFPPFDKNDFFDWKDFAYNFPQKAL